MSDYIAEELALLDQTDREFESINTLTNELLVHHETIDALNTHGVNPTALRIMVTTGLLSGTSLHAMALESQSAHLPTSVETQMAVEALTDKIKVKMAEWSAKIITFFNDKNDKLGEVIKGLNTKLKAAAQKASEKIFGDKDGAKQYAKAHPYKTIALALAAAVVAIGVLHFTAQYFPAFKDAAAVPKFMTKLSSMINAIKWPFGKVAAVLANSSTKVKLTVGAVGTVAVVGTVLELAWNKDKILKTIHDYGTLEHGLWSVWDGIKSKTVNALKDSWTMVKGTGAAVYHGGLFGYHTVNDVSPATRALSTVASMSLATFAVIVTGIGYLMYQLVKNIVVVAFRLACMTMVALGGATDNLSEVKQEESGSFI